jgi:hypothetical protein
MAHITVGHEDGEAEAARASGGPGRDAPVQIRRIGTDHVEVSIRAVDGSAETVAVLERLARLLDAGYDRIDVVPDTDRRPLCAPSPTRP